MGYLCTKIKWPVRIRLVHFLNPQTQVLNLNIISIMCNTKSETTETIKWSFDIVKRQNCHIWAVNKTWIGFDIGSVSIGPRIGWDSGSDWTDIFAFGAELLFWEKLFKQWHRWLGIRNPSSHNTSLTVSTRIFSFEPPVSPVLEFAISLKIIAKNYFQLNCSGKFSVA